MPGKKLAGHCAFRNLCQLRGVGVNNKPINRHLAEISAIAPGGELGHLLINEVFFIPYSVVPGAAFFITLPSAFSSSMACTVAVIIYALKGPIVMSTINVSRRKPPFQVSAAKKRMLICVACRNGQFTYTLCCRWHIFCLPPIMQKLIKEDMPNVKRKH